MYNEYSSIASVINDNILSNVLTKLPWVEKYRPLKIKNIIGNEDSIERLKTIIYDGNMPHIIISVYIYLLSTFFFPHFIYSYY